MNTTWLPERQASVSLAYIIIIVELSLINYPATIQDLWLKITHILLCSLKILVALTLNIKQAISSDDVILGHESFSMSLRWVQMLLQGDPQGENQITCSLYSWSLLGHFVSIGSAGFGHTGATASMWQWTLPFSSILMSFFFFSLGSYEV